ncbi:ATP-binding protein [Prauserella muralis]|uniref:Histidine kinase/HSP90-like ATPase domain-containing protein n=1 Tax=Prauserella muralis TaxID=588067 RepID=A0A2V4BCJ4_9PSEU|nr:ATP-binding protein [Prauserella muralis]PXY27329.1 hypothetical protein BAY60_12860 [Prauserella muralis]TWE22989.1 serine/threonine-protein kinase RsbW [Prauserella muralis]
MPSHELVEWTGPQAAGPVELRVPADSRQLPLIRALARLLAEREGLGREQVTDLVVAVDEACTCLITRSVPGAILTCRYAVAFGSLRVAVSTTTVDGTGPAAHALGWRLLVALTDSLNAWRYEHDPQRETGRVVHIDFAKQFAGRFAG